MKGRLRFCLPVVAAALVLPGGAARADAIDGNWCHKEGGRIVIQGSTVVTPGGKRMTGEYGRHDFSYVVPAPERGAGSKVDMRLMDEDTVHLRVGAATQVQVWKRCQAPAT